MCSKFKHHFAIFFLMVFAIGLSEGTLHGLLHAEMHEVHEMHVHHACAHGHEVEAETNDLPRAGESELMADEEHNDTCVRCAHFLVHDQVNLSSESPGGATIFAALPPIAACALYVFHDTELPSLRGPPLA